MREALTIGIREGKNREVRNVLEHLGLKVNRLIRVSFGPFELGEIERGDVIEVTVDQMREALGEMAKNIDLGGRLLETRHPEERGAQRRASKGDGPDRGRSSFEARPRRVEDAREGAYGRAPQDDGDRTRARRGKKHRRDRRGGPRPSRPRPKDER